MLMLGKLDFRSKNIIRDKEYDIMIEKMKTNEDKNNNYSCTSVQKRIKILDTRLLQTEG